MKKYLIVFVTFFMAIQTIKSQNKIIEIIATSDVHGALFPKDFVVGKDSIPSLANLSTYLNTQRNKSDREVLLLDNGDILQGDPCVYYYNYVDTLAKHIAAQTMNYLKFDAASVGNHDLESGHSVYDDFNKDLNFPFLSANIINKQTQGPYFIPYSVYYKAGYKIAVLGMTTPKVPKWLPEKLITNMNFIDMVESAQYWMSIIKTKEKPDLIVGLFHAGTDYSYNNIDTDLYMNENASVLVAEQVDGFDIIIAGHDHQGHNFTITNNYGKSVLIIAPTSRMKDFIDIEISFNDDSTKNIKSNLILTSSLPIDYSYIRAFQSNINEIEKYFSEPIGSITEDIHGIDGLFGDDALANLIHTIQLNITGADISFSAPMSLSAVIEKGVQYRKDLFRLYKYDNLLYTINLSGLEIKNYLEDSYWGWFNLMKDKNDYLLRYKLDSNNQLSSEYYPNTENQSYNFDSAEGIIYTVDVSKPKGERVNIISMQDGNPFDLTKTYKVAITSYRGSGGGNLLIKGAGISMDKLFSRVTYISDYNIKKYIEQWIKAYSPIVPNKSKNWKVIPESWYSNRVEKERKYFIPKK